MKVIVIPSTRFIVNRNAKPTHTHARAYMHTYSHNIYALTAEHKFIIRVMLLIEPLGRIIVRLICEHKRKLTRNFIVRVE